MLITTLVIPINNRKETYVIAQIIYCRTSEVKKYMIMSGLNPAKTGVGKGAPGGIKLTRQDLRYCMMSIPLASKTKSNPQSDLMQTNGKKNT